MARFLEGNNSKQVSSEDWEEINNNNNQHLEEEEEEERFLGYSKLSLPLLHCLGDNLQHLLLDYLGMLHNRILVEVSLEVNNNKQLLYLIKLNNRFNSQVYYLDLTWQILNLRIKDYLIQVAIINSVKILSKDRFGVVNKQIREILLLQALDNNNNSNKHIQVLMETIP